MDISIYLVISLTLLVVCQVLYFQTGGERWGVANNIKYEVIFMKRSHHILSLTNGEISQSKNTFPEKMLTNLKNWSALIRRVNYGHY